MHWLRTGRLSVEQLTISISGLPSYLEGVTLVQMSDFHYDGKHLSEQMLEDAIAASNKAQPDLVLLTGDYITHKPAFIHQLVDKLKYLKSRGGVYAVLGNHDNISYKGQSSKVEIVSALTSIGIQVLDNDIAYPLGKDLPLVGIADYRLREIHPAPVMNILDNDTPRIVICHCPDTAVYLQPWRVDLQLSGHTHGGQIAIPGLGALMPYYLKLCHKIPNKIRRRLPKAVNRANRPWWLGLYKVGNNLLYVNRGLGTYKPGRLFCPPEVTVIKLKANNLGFALHTLRTQRV
ncbi:MAG: metallophosphoesterase [Nostocaceae cyanobacterium]|nr:metallophosphoesterase [Nostocaceae cyanobacterium]